MLNSKNLLIATLLVVAVMIVGSFTSLKSTKKEIYINGQVNGFIIGCKNAGTPFVDCQEKSKGYEAWLRCDQNQKKCN